MSDPLTLIHQSRIALMAGRIEALGLAGSDDYHNYKPVIVNGQRYPSARRAGFATGIGEKAIRECCNGMRRPSWTFTARWA